MKRYDRTSHTVYHHRYHLVWITKYRYRVLTTAMKKRVRDIIAQVAEMNTSTGIAVLTNRKTPEIVGCASRTIFKVGTSP